MNNQKQPFCKEYRKIIAVISLICVLLSFSSTAASAAGAAKITVSSSTVERGATASVSFNLEGNPGIWGLKLRIHYDSSALTLKSVSSGAVFQKSELTLSESLSKNPYIVVASANELENKTSNGTIVTLTFSVNNAAEFKAYPVTAEVQQVYNVDGSSVSVDSVGGSITVVNCVHEGKEWRVTKAAKCETEGTETLTCAKCGKTFGTRAIKATGHQNTEVRNAVAATKKSEGYTGDTYCKDCGKLVSKGTAVAKLKSETSSSVSSTGGTAQNPNNTVSSTDQNTESTESETDNKPKITSGTSLVFSKDSAEPLVFVSNADFKEFIRVEVDGNILDEDDYTAESGSTVITIKKDYLSKLNSGIHTISIVSESGTAETEFTVTDESESADAETPSEGNSIDTQKKSFAVPIIITVAILLILAGAAAVYFVIQKRRHR